MHRALIAMWTTGLLIIMSVVATVASPALASSGLLDSDDLLVTTIPNDFYPAEADLSDCLSALPPPGCGSEAKGGWPQFAAMAFIVIGIGAIAARVTFSARRARRARSDGRASGDDDPGAPQVGREAASRSAENATQADTS